MRLTRQRFFLVIALLLAVQGLLAVAVATPLLIDAGSEAAHAVWQACGHPFPAHYLQPVTLAGALVMGSVLIVTVRFAWACLAAYRRTSMTVSALFAVAQPANSRRLDLIAARYGIKGHVKCVETDAPLAFCHGFVRPRIYVSSGLSTLLSDAELAAVLLHEEYHRQRREPLHLILLNGLVETLRFWQVLTSRMVEARTEMEVAADAHAVGRGGSPRALARALLKVLQQTAPSMPFADQSLALSPLSPTEARIECLTRAQIQPYPPLSWCSVTGPGLILAGITVGLSFLAAFSDLHPILHRCHSV